MHYRIHHIHHIFIFVQERSRIRDSTIAVLCHHFCFLTICLSGSRTEENGAIAGQTYGGVTKGR